MAVSWEIADTRAADGRVAITLVGVPVQLNRERIRRLCAMTARKLEPVLRAGSVPAMVTEETLQLAVTNGVLTQAKARQILSLQEEAESSASGTP